MFSKDRIVVIDSIGLAVGEISPSISPGWAAPEQILLRPVSPATDVFPLGMMIASILRGELTGELCRFLIPSKGGNPTVWFFKDPHIYIKPGSKIISKQSRNCWLDFIELCLKFDQSVRPKDGQTFSDMLDAILKDHPVNGNIELNTKHNKLYMAVLPDGRESPCHFVADSWKDFYRQRLWVK